MSKNDGDRDETPIQFYIPRISQRHGRAPVPVNQPHWKYKNGSSFRPTFGGWLSIIIFDLIMAALIYIALTEINNGEKWFIVIVATIMMASVTLTVVGKYLNRGGQQDEINQDATSNEKARKKYPKRRKDYH